MNTDIFPEAEYFLSSFLLGVAFLFCYDIFRILRRVIVHRWIAIAAEDILFWGAAGILAFRMIYEKNYGTIRGYAVLGMAFGMWLYYSFLSELYVRSVTNLLHKTGHLIYRFFFRLTYPIRFLVLKCKALYKKIATVYSKQCEKKRVVREEKQRKKEEKIEQLRQQKEQVKQQKKQKKEELRQQKEQVKQQKEQVKQQKEQVKQQKKQKKQDKELD